MKFSVYQASQIGARKYNQDRVAYAYSEDALLLLLADGMGGHLYGEVAAQIAIHTFMQAFEQAALPHVAEPAKFLSDTMRRAHENIVQYAREQHMEGNPGTTCVAALVQDDEIRWAHAGDSRLYLLRRGAPVAVTHDHSVVQQWADYGIISEDEMKTHPDRNKITNCLGGVGDLFYAESAAAVPVEADDVLLLCSDGMWSPLVDREIAAGLMATPLQPALDALMLTAVSREGARADNTTAVVARLGDNEETHDTAKPVCVILDLETEATAGLLGRTMSTLKPLIP
jgi:serine/threonine protein phosphatase PrpC